MIILSKCHEKEWDHYGTLLLWVILNGKFAQKWEIHHLLTQI